MNTALLALNPFGKLYIIQNSKADSKTQDSPALISHSINNQQIINAFKLSQEHGLLQLLATTDDAHFSNVLKFWRDYIAQYVSALCHYSSDEKTYKVEIPVPVSHVLEACLLRVPPMPGAEYCSVETLGSMWLSFDQWINDKINTATGISGFLKEYLPSWHQVGRVCFHLAENKHDEHYPFAFLATYTAALSNNSKLQHKPLSQALQEYAGTANHQALANLLNPIYSAAKHCEWLNQLVSSHDIYHPLAWSPQEAYWLLQSVPILEDNGLMVKLPNWWKKRAKPRVQVTMGTHKKGLLNAESLLKFDITIAMEGITLNQEELNDIFTTENGLVFLRGQWVELDKEKLQEALTHWQTLQKAVGHGGISFIEGMRLLAGASHNLAPLGFTEELQEWYGVEASPILQTRLEELRNPNMIKAKPLTTLLRASLRPYQEVGVNWLNLLTQLGLGACLADDMGLGKTIQVIALLLLKKQQNSDKNPSILVLPTSLLANWKAEIVRFAPSLKVDVVHGKLAKPIDLNDIDIIITTYGMLLRQEWLIEQSWHLVILDEAQAIKNPGSTQTKLAKKLKGKARIALTGTPIENRLGDLWSLFDFICPGLLGTTTRFKEFIKSLEKKAPSSYAPLRQLVQPYLLRRLKTDKKIINDLPDKTEVDAWCGLSKVQAKLYMQAVQEMTKALGSSVDGIKRRGLVLAFLTKFKQICNHPSQLLSDVDYTENDSGKFIRLREICEEIASRQEKVLVFTQYREITQPLADFLATIFGRQGLILNGGTSVKQREQFVTDFQSDSGSPFFILSLKAGGTGLNLTAASHVIHFDRWWNPAVENQASDRAYRIGQKKNVLIHKFICKGTIEEKIDAMIREKKQLAHDVLAIGGEMLLTELDNKKLLDLVALDINQAMI